MNDYERTLLALVAAARERLAVTLVDGRTGVLVYAPSPTRRERSPKRRPLRHGDVEQCGVRIDGRHRDSIEPVPVVDIVEIRAAS